MTAGSIVRQTGMGLFTLGAFVFASACFLWLTFKNFEPVIFPVVDGFEIHDAYISGESLYISGTFDKRRQCEFNDVVAYSGKKFIKVEFLEDQGETVNRLTRLQTYGPWRLTPKAMRLQIYASHTCGTGDVITTLFDDTVTVSSTRETAAAIE